MGTPAHNPWLPEIIEVGLGLTVTVEVKDAPWQLPTVGIMVNVTVTGELVVLVSDPVIFPLPLDAIPVTKPVLFLVQL